MWYQRWFDEVTRLLLGLGESRLLGSLAWSLFLGYVRRWSWLRCALEIGFRPRLRAVRCGHDRGGFCGLCAHVLECFGARNSWDAPGGADRGGVYGLLISRDY